MPSRTRGYQNQAAIYDQTPAILIPRTEPSSKQGTVNTAYSTTSSGGVKHQLVIDDTVTSSGVVDPVLFFGANVTGGGALVDNAKGGAWVAIEGDYYTNSGFDGLWHHQNEMHLQMTNPGNTTARRVFSASYDWALGKTDTSLHGDYFSIAAGNGTQVLNWSDGTGVYLHRALYIESALAEIGLTNGTADANLRLNHKQSAAGGIVFATENGDIWRTYMTGDKKLYQRDNDGGRMAQTWVSGTAGSSSARTDIDTRLRVVRGTVGQTDNIVEVCDQAGTVLAAFTPAGDLRLGGNTGPLIKAGTGTPAGVVSAPVGSLYLRSDGGASTTLYVKESGVGTAGWVAK